MRLSRLIAIAAEREFHRDPGLLGVRLSPVQIKKVDAATIVSDAVDVLGKKIHVSVSVPGAAYEDKARVCIAPDHRAAERATAWRNSVRVAEDEHILYVSVERHGKAGGLQDCLYPLDESALRASLIDWAKEPKSGLPEGLGLALQESGVVDRVSASTLCAYVSAVLADSKKVAKWDAVGRNLPILGFAMDSRLKLSDAVERLRLNSDLVTKTAAAESRHQSLVTRSPVLSDLARALHGSQAEDLTKRLGRVDLGSLTTSALDKTRTPERKIAALKPHEPASRKALPQPKRKTKAAPEREAPIEKDVAASDAMDAALEVEGCDREESLAEGAKRLLQTPLKKDAAEATPSRGGQGKLADASDEVWTTAMHRREFGPSSSLLPSGLQEIVVELAKRGGLPVTWPVQRDPRACFAKLPATISCTLDENSLPEELSQPFSEWSRTRAEVTTRLIPGGNPGPLLSFVSAPLTALGDPELRNLLRAFLDCALALFRAVQEAPGEEIPRRVLSFDTGRIVDKADQSVIVLSPLHPLWLGQVMSRFDGMLKEPTLDKEARRLLARSLTDAPAAPQVWPRPRPQSELRLGRPEGGLIVYESEPTSTDEGTLRFVGERLALQYLDLLPHARFGLRVAVFGDGASPLVEGIALAADRLRDLKKVEILYAGSDLNLEGRATSQAISSGQMALRPIPADEESPNFRPHLVVRIVPPPQKPEEEEEAIPEVPIQGVGSGLLPTEFAVSRAGLRARIPLDGHPILENVEAVHALARGRMPQRAFISDARVTLLSTVFGNHVKPSGAWHIAIGRHLGRRPPSDTFLLAHERVSESEQFVAVTDNVNPASRALESGFRKLGVNDLRPSTLRALASRLAAASATGLLSLAGSDNHLVAAGLLGLALRREFGRDSSCVLAPLERAAASTLVGGVPSDGNAGAMTVAIGADGAKLRLILGFATLSDAVPAEITRGQLSGDLGEQFARMTSVFGLATKSSSLGSLAAREAVNWLLWPAIAAAEVHPPELIRLVQGLGKGTELSLSILCLLSPASPLTAKRGDSRVGKTPVQILSLDLALFERLVLSSEGAS